jgi:hypothetical protein
MSSVAKSIELLAEGDTLEEATEAAVEEASKTIGSCWIEGEAGVHQHSKKPSGHLFEVVFPLEDGHVLGQILLVNPAKATQKISQPRPDSIVLLCTSLKPSPSASRAHSPSEWLTDSSG